MDLNLYECVNIEVGTITFSKYGVDLSTSRETLSRGSTDLSRDD